MFSWLAKKIRGDDDENHEPRRKNSVSGRRKSTNEVPQIVRSNSTKNDKAATIPSATPSESRARTNTGSSVNTEWGTPCESNIVGPKMIAKFDYEGRTLGELSFKKGEKLEILEETTAPWCLARSSTTGKMGHIPVEFVARYKSIEAEPWYFGEISRGECERKLLSSTNDHGSFMIRNSESRKNEYSLSVRDMNNIMHYRVRMSDQGKFFITRKATFDSIHELVDHYSRDASGLCTKLYTACASDTPETRGLSPDTWDSWEIPKEQVKLERLLGSGQFGEVYQGKWNMTVPVAVKTLKPGRTTKEEFLEEAQILKNLRHPRLLQLYAVSTQEEPFFIITELMQNGSLLEYLRRHARDTLLIMEQVTIGAEVAAGMEFLESKNYVHRDLAARNVLVGENGHVKVADFGLSRLMQENEYTASEGSRFPIKWTAPEALRQNKFTTKSDVWSFGVLLMEVVTSGMVPYPEMTNIEVMKALEDGYRMPQPSKCPLKLYNIMLECWAKNPTYRPSFQDLHCQLDDFFLVDTTDYMDVF